MMTTAAAVDEGTDEAGGQGRVMKGGGESNVGDHGIYEREDIKRRNAVR